MEGFYFTYWQAFVVPLIAIVLDVVVGFIAASNEGTLDSTVMRHGMWTKLSEVCAIVFALFLEFAFSVYGDFFAIKIDVPISYAMCAYLTLYETVSILENLGRINPTVADSLIRVIGIKPEKMNMIPVDIDSDNGIAGEDDTNEADNVEPDSSVR